MAKILIQGVAYPIPTRFTNRELSMIKQISGVRGQEIQAAAKAGDNDLLVAFAMIVLTRANQKPNIDKLMDLDVGEIDAELEPGDEGYEVSAEVPPPAAAEAANEEKPIQPKLHDVSGARG